VLFKARTETQIIGNPLNNENTKIIILRCAVCDETRSSYDEIEKHLEADHNAQPEIANLIIKMLQELQKMITTNNELKRELNELRQMLKGASQT
jgi:hypothetical protein